MPRHVPNHAPGADAITIPYSAIIKVIPQELWGKLAPAGVAGYSYTIARKSVLEQIPHGSVKVSFGDLRRGAPSGVFISTPAEDSRLVDLPLSEVLAQLHPDTFARRPDQAKVEVSTEVPDLFGAKGERLAPLRVMEKKEVSNTTFTRQNLASPSGTRPPIPAPAAPMPPNNIMPLQPPVATQPSAPHPTGPMLRMQSGAGTNQQSAPIPFPFPKPNVPGTQQPLHARPPVAPMPLPRPVAATPSHAAAPSYGGPTTQVPGAGSFNSTNFFIALDAIAESWPDGVRQELAQLKMPDAKVALPSTEICEGLKRGRIQYPWRTVRSWIQPTPIYASPSPHDDVVLELPLKTLTPLFLEFIRANPVNRQAADAENITEFFRKAEQVSGTSPELLQPLFDVPDPFPLPTPTPAQAPTPTPMPAPAPAPAVRATAPVPPFAAPAAPAAPAPAGFASPAPVAAAPVTPAAAGQTSASEPVIENGLLWLPLQLIATGWPEPVVRDIAQFNLTGARVGIPLASVEPGLKSGRIEFSWREICGWLTPPSQPAQMSINGEVRVALGLGMIAPLFMKQRSGAGARRKTAVAESIPDLFSAAGKPAPTTSASVNTPATPEPAAAHAAAAPAKPAATPEPAPAPAPVRKAPTNLSELFGEPQKKSWTPNEIVQRTATLANVAGSLIALQDGLLVASNMPANLKTETVSAFLPQIFGRLNQYSKELQMGEASAVSFAVAAGTLQIYNAGIIYFAVLGKPGTVLPLADLQLIAVELSRHTK